MKILPIITEKSYRLAAGDKQTSRQFSFWIDRKINKLEAKREIEAQHKVEVISSRIISLKGKVKKFRNQIGQTSDRKKIIVTLKPGQVIKSFEIEEKKDDKHLEKTK